MTGWHSPRLVAKVSVSRRRGAIVSTALVAGDAIYTADAFGGDLVKLDRATLRERWRVPRGEDPIAVFGKALLVAGAETSAVDTETGTILWTSETGYGVLDWKGKPVLKHANRPFRIVEPHTGAAIASLDVPPASPEALCGDIILFRTDPGNDPLRAYSLAERREVWAHSLLSDIRAQHDVRDPKPVINCVPGPGDVFVGSCGDWTFGASLEDGRLLWGVPVVVPYYWPNVHAGRVYVLNFNRLIGIDAARGEIAYEVTHPELREHAYRARPGTIFGETIAFANESGLLAVFNLWNGSLVWSYKHRAPLWGTAEADGRLLVSTGDGNLLVFAERH